MSRTVVALFAAVEKAQAAVEALLREGFNQNDVSVLRASQEAASAAAGASAGGGRVAEALIEAGIAPKDAESYAESVRQGGTLITVLTSESEYDRAMQILNRFSPVDVRARATAPRSSSGTGSNTNQNPFTNVYAREFEDAEPDFQNDWQTRYGGKGYDYERYRPAYRYGWDAHKLFSGRDWTSIEPELRADWERAHPSDVWGDFQEAVATGWDRFTSGARDA